MKFSILMTTYNRPQQLTFVLRSIRRQNIGGMNHEILVLDDGSEDQTEKVVKRFTEEGGLCLRYIKTGVRTIRKWRCMGFTANIGIQQAKGEIIVLTNSDIFHLGETVRPVIKAVKEDEMAMSTLHEVWDDPGDLIQHLRDGEEGRGVNALRKLDEVMDGIRNGPRPEGWYPANPDVPFFLAVRREHLLKVGGYDEDFIGVASEDNDLLDRLKMLGCHYTYAPKGSEAIHLYHGRKSIKDLQQHPGFAYNIRLREERRNVLVRNAGRSWGELINPYADAEGSPMHLVVWVTSKCNLDCEHCNQRKARTDFPDHEMSREELNHIIKSCLDRGIHFSTVELTGGEPTLWPHFEWAIYRLRESGITDEVTFITNGRNPKRTTKVANRYGLYYVVSKPQCSEKDAKIHREKGVGVTWNEGGHRPIPKFPVPGALPSACMQRRDANGRVVRQLFYLMGWIHYCCMAHTNSGIVGRNSKLRCKFDDDFPSYFFRRPDNFPICRVCLCNKNVWDRIEPIP